MKLQPVTLALLISAAVLGTVVYFAELHPSAQQRQPESGATDLFAFEEGDVQSFSVTTPLRTLSFEKSTEGVWQMQEPESAPANEASVAYLLNLLATGQSDRTLTVPTADWESFGFHQPLADITVTLADGTTHTLKVGEYDFNRSFLYGLKDAPENAPEGLEELGVLLVSPDFENAVSRPLEDWKRPPDDPATDSPDASESPTEDAPENSSVESTEPPAEATPE